MAFAQHVTTAIPSAEHVVLECGHVPQLEQPAALHAAIRAFLVAHPLRLGRRAATPRLEAAAG